MAEGKLAVKSVGMVMVAGIISKVTGFFRETFIAAVFGASRVTDAYLVALTIPSMLFSGFQNALQITVVPVFTEQRTKLGAKAAFAMVNSLINLTLLISLAVTSIGMIAVPWIVKILAPGFDPAMQTLSVNLARVMFPMIAGWSLTGIMSGILNTYNKFTLPALAGVPYNIVIILFLALMGHRWGVMGLAWATLVAVGGQVLFLMPGFFRLAPKWLGVLDLKNPGLKKIMRMSVPVLAASLVSQTMAIVDRVLGSGLPEGSIAALTFAERVNALVLGMVAVSIATVMFPALARHVAEGELEIFKDKVGFGLNVVSFFVLPMAALLFTMAEPIIQVVFQRGAFDGRATEMTALALRYYAIGLLAVAVRVFLEKVFYSLKDSFTPMVLASSSLCLNIGLSVLLVRFLNLGGLALGTALAQIIYVTAALIILWQRKLLNWQMLWQTWLRIIPGSAGLGLVLFGAVKWVRPLLSQDFLGQVVFLSVAGAAGMLVYLPICLLFGAPEPSQLWQIIRGKGRVKTPQYPDDAGGQGG
ncbi:MAG TPA: murein biosynthesis integral membrane protein MurJ [Bacillota bacterium]|nr:murein biosynthesis integral membrane protein MurJ [Bacillota bacterium]